MKQAHLLDISAIFFRYYFAPGPYIENDEGWDVSALKSTFRWLCQKQFLTSYTTVAAFDESLGSGFRHEIDEDYKANRPLPTEDIVYQLTALKHLCEHLGFTVVASEELEADDLIASSAHQLVDCECTIHSRDKDLRQLLLDRVSMLDPVSGKHWDLANFKEVMEIEPSQVPLYLALMGDSSDNITGLPGIGDKTARRMLGCAKNLDDLLVQAEDPSNWHFRGAAKVASTVLEYQELIEHNLSLTELVLDAEIDFRKQQFDDQDLETIKALADRFGINKGLDKSYKLLEECVI